MKQQYGDLVIDGLYENVYRPGLRYPSSSDHDLASRCSEQAGPTQNAISNDLHKPANDGIEGQGHNNVHNELGGQMSSPAYAAFNPIFWLHHCNIDRLYESYIAINGASQVAAEFEANQDYKSRMGRPDGWEEPLEPSKKSNGMYYMPSETLATQPHGYEYDQVTTQRPASSAGCWDRRTSFQLASAPS